ncbi:MAG: acyltransferase [Leptolyngbyaceae cyanobacterium CSU_1_3]|nr:acyltransferase [Leptolyngbyaceae cyanobacterium CSU_1_3]
MNNRNTYVEPLDYLRGFAIVSVLIFHAAGFLIHRGQLPWEGWFRDFSVPRSALLVLPASFGWAGVAIFFVISGFCIHLSFSRSRQPNFLGFYIRRFFRIYPPYLIALIVFIAFLPMTQIEFSSPSFGLDLFSHLVLLQNFGPHALSVNPSFWSVVIEAQLYVIYPLLLLLTSQFGWKRTLLGIGILEVLLRTALGIADFNASLTYLPEWLTRSPLVYWYSWSIGAWLADNFLQNKPLPFARSRLSVWLLLAVTTFFIRPLSELSFLFFAVFTTTWIAKLLSKPKVQFSLPSACLKVLRYAGIWSYSLYLLHQPLMSYFVRTCVQLSPSQHLHSLIQFLIAILSLVFIVPIAALYYRYCELPSIALGKRLIRRLQMAG